MNDILLTGATGFIGKNLIQSLKLKYNIHILVRPSTNYVDLCLENIYVFEDNIEELSEYLKRNNIEGIIHLASLYIAQHQSNQIKNLVLSNIYLGTALLEASVKANLKWFLNTGTIWQNYIFDSIEYCPVNLYAATKQAFIDVAKYYTEISNLKFCTLKICDTYGPGDTRRKILSLFKQISETGETLDMSLGNQKIDLLHIDDVIQGFLYLVSLLKQEPTNLAAEYVLSSNKLISLRELADLFEQYSENKIRINWGKRKYRDREVMTPWSKGIPLPKWTPMISLEQGIQQLLK